ncbi:MAG TPA: protein kinase, partial [Pyrinomonadaceae bacterium]|nr:protein kinase [Pyrinomonadaceae bacterium]
MNNDWQHLQSLFHAALSLKVEDRADYLARECVGDEGLRREVESLLAASEKPCDPLEQPAFNLGLQVLSYDSQDEPLTGRTIGSFKILSVLGNGGMGDVYLAEDTQLGRKVALKFLSGGLVNDQWAKRQFTKEAQAVAMLDHPNICPVHGFEGMDGHSFIIMQYVEGVRLDHLILERKLEPGEILSLSVQIASALAEAHAHSIIHRDIKPPNIMVMANRQVKVLDFGLAKLVQQQQESILNAEEPPSHSLQLGFIPGTIAYMSPEQLRGERLDYRTDIFSFGAVLYEMIGGRNPFARATKAETISAILTSEPPSLRHSAPHIPRELDRIAQKCLEKERDERYQSASELLVDLDALQKTIDGDSKRRPWSFSVRAVAATTLLLLLVVVATFIYGYLTRPRTIAVLPISNETGDVNLDYLGDGLTESIINKLSGLSRLRVKAFSTVSGYKGQQIDPQKIGRDLNVDAVVMGRLTGSKELLNLQTVMVNTADGSQLWGNGYKLGLEDIFHIEDDVARQVTFKLELWPRRDEDRILVTPRPRNPQAHDQFMLGKFYWRFRNKENIYKAIEHFQEAIRLDPLYAQAYAGLADSYVLLNTVHYGKMDTKEAMTKAEAAAKEALELDDGLPEAHTSLGVINLKRYWNWQEAEREFKRAIQINPDYAPAHYAYSNLLVITGRLREAIAESETANNLDPFSPVTHLNYCRAFYYARDYDRASACFEKLVKEQPDYTNSQYVLGLVYLRRGMYQEATAIFEKLYAADKSSAGAALGHTYGVAGRRADALKVLSEMETLAKTSHIPEQEFAIIYLGLGDKENAFIRLEKAANEHFAPLAYISVDPLFDSIRSDARFAELARSLNLPLRPPS